MLKNKFSSSCRCARCSDPTELGTFSSSLLCPAQSCRSAVISADVSDLSSDWRCSTCSKLFPASKISNVTAAIKEQAEKLEFNKDHPEKCGVEAHEAFLKKYKQILHPNHVTLIRVKYNLAKMYGGCRDMKLTIFQRSCCRGRENCVKRFWGCLMSSCQVRMNIIKNKI